MLGPIFSREATLAPKRGRHYVYRAVYALAFVVLMLTAWMVVAGTQVISTPGDMARFGTVLFAILAPLQLAVVVFLGALSAASTVAQEKDRRTMILLLLTRMSNSELVLGKLAASLLNLMAMLLAALPVFMLTTLFGGVSAAQVVRVFVVTAAAGIAAASLGSTIALWREKTFQTLAMTALILMMWLGVWQVVYYALGNQSIAGWGWDTIATACSPLLAVLASSGSSVSLAESLRAGDGLFVLVAAGITVALNAVAIWKVRIWNPSRQIRPGQQETDEAGSIWGAEHDLAGGTQERAEAARAGHVDSIGRERPPSNSRRVWDNPILWRETCTWAYGRKVLVIKAVYLLLTVLAAIGLSKSLQGGVTATSGLASVVPASALPLAPFFFISVVLINALAVTSITNERDGQALDLLLATDISPKEFVFGKIGGVFWVTKEMVLLPMGLCVFMWAQGGVIGEDLFFLLCSLLVMYLFANMLGIHCGMTYANSRSAIGVSLGAVFFLFLGVITCVMVMISFSGSFSRQLPAFLAFSLGGSVGLYVSLGMRNPSPAMFCAALLLPFTTFYAITSFLIGQSLPTFIAMSAVYGFTTLAMMMPAIGEFDIAMGRTKTAAED